MQIEPIDLRHQGTERVIGVYLLDTAEGPALFDCGPSTCVAELERGLAGRGLELTDVRHLLLSHIHLDHAGAAGSVVRASPGLQVHVSPVGAPHLVDPSRLEASAPLWGGLVPVPEENVHPIDGHVLGLEAFPTPGHASHHVSYVGADGILYAGDAVGVRVQPGRHVLPVSPPPDIDVEAWRRTLDAIEARAPERLALIHFGVVDEPGDHVARTREELERWSERVRSGMDEDEFVAACRHDLVEAEGEDEADLWEKAAPLWQSYQGLRRYWDKRAER
jgi:glyoxylase-like metal-dependent hydrolase (beta-lactamase superfamily II)